MTRIDIATQFSETPGFRFPEEGPYSGQEFRDTFLTPLFENLSDNSPIEVVFDGVAGFATSFLEESFGGLARKYGTERCLTRLKFISEEDPLLISEVKGYITDANIN